MIGQANVNVPTAIGQTIISKSFGASNRERVQGQIVISGAKVTNSMGYGVRIDAGGRDANGLPEGGVPRNLLTLNTDRLATGAVVMNSQFLGNMGGGISVTGEQQTTGVAAAVPYARLINNTIVGTVGRASFQSREFADSVDSYQPGLSGTLPDKGLDDPAAALGAPNYVGTGEPTSDQGAVSLGVGGQLVVEFTNNNLQGDGTANPDLRIVEVGIPETYSVDVSTNGVQFIRVATNVSGLQNINIDGIVPPQQNVRYVRIIDGASLLGTAQAAGADIDAVIALSSVTNEVGVRVQSNASPTLVNNVIANSIVGLSIDASSASTVVGGTVFHRNTTNTQNSATTGQFPLVVNDTASIFVDVTNGNLYPAANSPIIDSSIDSLQDRLSLASVKNSIGIGSSTIQAPQYDVNGLLRVDDATVASPGGLGDNVFKDRGAQDRADFNGPTVLLVNPVDNDVDGLDGNPAEAVVELTNFTAKSFDIQLLDGLEPGDPNRGSNINDDTVTSASVLLYQDGRPLVEGVNYRFGYDKSTNLIRLTPLAGIFEPSSVFEIRFVNTRQFAIATNSGSQYTDGAQFNVITGTNTETTFELDTGFVVTVPSTNGLTADVVEGGTFTVDDGLRRLTFEFDTDGSVSAGNLAVTITTGASPSAVATAITSALTAAQLQLSIVNLGSALQIDASPLASILPGTSALTVAGAPGVRTEFGLKIPSIAGRPVSFIDGETFTITRTGAPVTFELDTNGIVTPGRIAVRFSSTASMATIGQALVSAIRGANIGLNPSYLGNGIVSLGGDATTVLGVTNTQLLQTGVAGKSAARQLKISVTASADAIATQLANAIKAVGLVGVNVSVFNNRIVINGVTDVNGTGAGLIQTISDNAGNVLKGNQADGSSVLTVFLGEGLDFGDAPDPSYKTLKESNGPSHVVVSGLSLGAEVRPDADAKLIDADEGDDGVTITSPDATADGVAGFLSRIDVNVTRPVGTTTYVKGWIDFNGDGTFADDEVVFNQTVSPLGGPVVTVTKTDVMIPAEAKIGTTYGRFRMSTKPEGVASPIGSAVDGEVEDYAVTIISNPYTNTRSTNLPVGVRNLDVNGDGSVSPIDVLQVINDINVNGTRTLPYVNNSTIGFVDTNGDGTVSGFDVLLIIAYLNSLGPGGAEGEGDSGAADLGGSSSTVDTSNWMDGVQTLGAPAIETKLQSEEEEVVVVADAFFETEDDTDVMVMNTSATGGSPAAIDDVLASMTGTTDEIADQVATQLPSLYRQRLSVFRK